MTDLDVPAGTCGAPNAHHNPVAKCALLSGIGSKCLRSLSVPSWWEPFVPNKICIWLVCNSAWFYFVVIFCIVGLVDRRCCFADC